MHGISLEEEEVFEIHIHCFELERESKNSANCIWKKVSFNGASAAAVLYGIKSFYYGEYLNKKPSCNVL